jgi:hypothetical protein
LETPVASINAQEAIRKIKLLQMASEKLPITWQAEIEMCIDQLDLGPGDEDPYAETEGMMEVVVEALKNEIARLRAPFDGIDLGV